MHRPLGRSRPSSFLSSSSSLLRSQLGTTAARESLWSPQHPCSVGVPASHGSWGPNSSFLLHQKGPSVMVCIPLVSSRLPLMDGSLGKPNPQWRKFNSIEFQARDRCNSWPPSADPTSYFPNHMTSGRAGTSSGLYTGFPVRWMKSQTSLWLLNTELSQSLDLGNLHKLSPSLPI